MGAAKDLAHQVVRAFNKGDLDAVMSLYAPDAVSVTPVGREEGTEAIRVSIGSLLTAFPDGQDDIVAGAEEGDVYMFEFTYRGTNTA